MSMVLNNIVTITDDSVLTYLSWLIFKIELMIDTKIIHAHSEYEP